MAAPSQIPGHQQTAAVDSDGDAFPSGSSFYVNNLCSNGQQSLAFDFNSPGTTTHATRDAEDRKWIIQYNDEDRTKIALKSSSNGRYLAATGPGYGTKLWLAENLQWWYVYQGAQPRTFWLGTTQSADSFVHTWNCYGGEGAQVLLFTNLDANSGRFYGLPYASFEEFTSGLSWQLQPTPEHREWKAKQGQVNGATADTASSDKDAEAKLRHREADLEKREKGCQEKESDISKQSDALTARERESKKNEAEIEKQQKALSSREEKVEAAEKRLKQSKKSGSSDHLASLEEIDQLKEENAKLKEEAKSHLAEIESLKARPAQKSKPLQLPSSTGSALSNNGVSTISPPKKITPGGTIPSSFNSDLVKKFQTGKKSMKTLS